MSETKFYDLAVINAVYDGYYFDAEMNVWTEKLGGCVRKLKNQDGAVFDGSKYPYSIISLRLVVKVRDDFKQFVKTVRGDEMNGETSQAMPSIKGGYVIARINESNIPVFSSCPKVHRTKEDAMAEVTRLAKMNKGHRFAYFRCEGSAVASDISWE